MASAVGYATRSISGNQPLIRDIAEKALQTFKAGVPVMLNAGYVQEWDGITVANGIAGVTKVSGANLTTNGVAKILTFGDVPNQTSAQNIPRGAPLNDGTNLFEVATDDSVFFFQVGPAQLTSQANIGVNYGMTKDTDGHWYVDTTKLGASAVCQVVKLDYNDTTRGVQIVFLRSAQQVLA